MQNAIRARRAHFFLVFWWKSDLGLSWRHLRGIMGRLGKIFWVVLAPKTPSLGPKTPPRWAQDPQENKTKIVVIRVPCSRAAQERPRALQGAPGPMEYPSWCRFWDDFSLILVPCRPQFHLYFGRSSKLRSSAMADTPRSGALDECFKYVQAHVNSKLCLWC